MMLCPDCKETVSKEMKACPKCGCPSDFFEENNIPEETRIKYEYKVLVKISGEDLEDELNRYGNVGWKLVVHDGKVGYNSHIILERMKQLSD